MATTSEAAFKQMIATLVRHTRPQAFRQGKPLRYPQRSIATAAAVKDDNESSQESPRWAQHRINESIEPSLNRSRLDALKQEQEPRSFSSFLTDNYSRQHNYLRISVTERCNLRCTYCMPAEGIQLSPTEQTLTSPEIVYLSELFVKQGVDKIRLTGGEPTVRRDIVELMRDIGQLRAHGLKELCITSNGISLHRKLDAMVESGLTGVNLSLDTLDPHQFMLMTRRRGHEAVMKSINRIVDMNKMGAGIKLKINCVVMRNINERELVPFVEMGKDTDLEVRFIEYMPFDGNKWSKNKMLSYQEMLALIRQKYPDVHKVQDHANDTSKTYKVPGFKGRIGFITSMTHNFCGTCNRLRITNDGNLKVCLFGNSEVSLRDVLRESNNGKPIDAEAMEAIRQVEMNRQQGLSAGALGVTEREAQLLDIIGLAVKRKKEKHAGIGELENMKNRPMILIDEPIHASLLSASRSHSSVSRLQSPRLVSSAAYAHSMHRSIPVHLLPALRTSFSLQQLRCKSTFLGRRGYISDRKIWYYDYIASRQIFSLSKADKAAREVSEGRLERAVESSGTEGLQLNKDSTTILLKGAQGSLDDHRFVDPEEADDEDSAQPLTHLTEAGAAHMVDISHKTPTTRSATAEATLFFSKTQTLKSLIGNKTKKGDAIAVARVAAIQAAKRTSELIPLAHPALAITAVTVDIEPFAGSDYASVTTTKKLGSNPAPTLNTCGGVLIRAMVACQGKTGIEMEAITSATMGAVTMYDMLKGIDKAMVINNTRVVAKSGGKSGDWTWDEEEGRLKMLSPRLADSEALSNAQDWLPMHETPEEYATLPVMAILKPQQITVERLTTMDPKLFLPSDKLEEMKSIMTGHDRTFTQHIEAATSPKELKGIRQLWQEAIDGTKQLYARQAVEAIRGDIVHAKKKKARIQPTTTTETQESDTRFDGLANTVEDMARITKANCEAESVGPYSVETERLAKQEDVWNRPGPKRFMFSHPRVHNEIEAEDFEARRLARYEAYLHETMAK